MLGSVYIPSVITSIYAACIHGAGRVVVRIVGYLMERAGAHVREYMNRLRLSIKIVVTFCYNYRYKSCG